MSDPFCPRIYLSNAVEGDILRFPWENHKRLYVVLQINNETDNKNLNLLMVNYLSPEGKVIKSSYTVQMITYLGLIEIVR